MLLSLNVWSPSFGATCSDDKDGVDSSAPDMLMAGHGPIAKLEKAADNTPPPTRGTKDKKNMFETRQVEITQGFLIVTSSQTDTINMGFEDIQH